MSTVGASFVTKRVLDSTSDTVVRLQIWDTAGQERFRSISRLYYRGANAGLLCYDITDEESFREMTGWLRELKQQHQQPGSSGGEGGEGDTPLIIHVVGTKSDIVADDPSKRKVPFEKTIAYVAEQLYPTQASTPPPSSGMGIGALSPPSMSNTHTHGHGHGPGHGLESKRNSGFWGQDIGWDCCHEISAKDGEGIEEVFRVIARKLVEQQRNKLEAEASAAVAETGAQRRPRRGRGERPSISADGGAGAGTAGIDHADGNPDSKRRSWLGFPPALVLHDEREESLVDGPTSARKQGRCC